MLVSKDKKGGEMVRKTYTPEQIINKLREAEVLRTCPNCLTFAGDIHFIPK